MSWSEGWGTRVCKRCNAFALDIQMKQLLTEPRRDDMVVRASERHVMPECDAPDTEARDASGRASLEPLCDERCAGTDHARSKAENHGRPVRRQWGSIKGSSGPSGRRAVSARNVSVASSRGRPGLGPEAGEGRQPCRASLDS